MRWYSSNSFGEPCFTYGYWCSQHLKFLQKEHYTRKIFNGFLYIKKISRPKINSQKYLYFHFAYYQYMKFEFCMLVYVIEYYCFKTYWYFLMFHCDDLFDVLFSLYFISENWTKVQFFLHHQHFLPTLALLKDFTNLGNSIIQKLEKLNLVNTSMIANALNSHKTNKVNNSSSLNFTNNYKKRKD